MNTAQLAIFNRGIFHVIEELLDLISMTDTTIGSDLYNFVEKRLNELEVDWNTFKSITTDGSSAMLDDHNLLCTIKNLLMYVLNYFYLL